MKFYYVLLLYVAILIKLQPILALTFYDCMGGKESQSCPAYCELLDEEKIFESGNLKKDTFDDGDKKLATDCYNKFKNEPECEQLTHLQACIKDFENKKKPTYGGCMKDKQAGKCSTYCEMLVKEQILTNGDLILTAFNEDDRQVASDCYNKFKDDAECDQQTHIRACIEDSKKYKKPTYEECMEEKQLEKCAAYCEMLVNEQILPNGDLKLEAFDAGDQPAVSSCYDKFKDEPECDQQTYLQVCIENNHNTYEGCMEEKKSETCAAYCKMLVNEQILENGDVNLEAFKGNEQILASYCYDKSKNEPECEQQMRLESCMFDSKNDTKLINMLDCQKKTNESSTSKKHNCYDRCIVLKQGYMSEEHEIKDDFLPTNFDSKFDAKAFEAFDKCLEDNKQPDDVCLEGMKIFNCSLKAIAELRSLRRLELFFHQTLD